MSDVSLAVPHPMHYIGLRQILARPSIRDLPITGWRYLVVAEEEAVASSEVSVGTDRRPPLLEEINMGPFVRSTASAVRALDELPEARSGRYELHTLQIPALWSFLLWLRRLDGDDDLFIPLAPAPEFLQAGQVYREGDLLDVLEAPARFRLEFDASPPGSNGGNA
ncbi:hypothetical protein [Streptomyces sp. E-08]|uniref:hypothetical protein n=1 Tax=Streptomyces sp. E-08 TaxID=3404047 RepID=UPI003CF25C5E